MDRKGPFASFATPKPPTPPRRPEPPLSRPEGAQFPYGFRGSEFRGLGVMVQGFRAWGKRGLMGVDWVK